MKLRTALYEDIYLPYGGKFEQTRGEHHEYGTIERSVPGASCSDRITGWNPIKGDQVAHESGGWIVSSGCVNHPDRISQPDWNLR